MGILHKLTHRILAAAILVSGLGTPLAFAEDRYIIDVLYVPLRSGIGNQYRIVQDALQSGTKLNAIRSEMDTESNEEWTLVETTAGKQGWLRSRFLQNEPIAKQALETQQARVKTLTEERNRLQEQLKTVQGSNQNQSQDLQTAQAEIARLSKELEEITRLSEGAINLNNSHQKLMENHQLLQTQLDVVKADNERLRGNDNKTMIIYGAGAVIIGILLTLVAQSVRAKRRYSEWG